MGTFTVWKGLLINLLSVNKEFSKLNWKELFNLQVAISGYPEMLTEKDYIKCIQVASIQWDFERMQ